MTFVEKSRTFRETAHPDAIISGITFMDLVGQMERARISCGVDARFSDSNRVRFFLDTVAVKMDKDRHRLYIGPLSVDLGVKDQTFEISIGSEYVGLNVIFRNTINYVALTNIPRRELKKLPFFQGFTSIDPEWMAFVKA